MRAFLERAAAPTRNVGGVDLGTRAVASVMLCGLVYLMVPAAQTPWHLTKIALLACAEVGVVSLMLGLFLRAKTYYCGAQLLGTSLLMLWCGAQGLTWAGIAVGGVSTVAGTIDLITRKSRFNAALDVSSWREPLQTTPAAPPPHPNGAH